MSKHFSKWDTAAIICCTILFSSYIYEHKYFSQPQNLNLCIYYLVDNKYWNISNWLFDASAVNQAFTRRQCNIWRVIAISQTELYMTIHWQRHVVPSALRTNRKCQLRQPVCLSVCLSYKKMMRTSQDEDNSASRLHWTRTGNSMHK